jgi:hypothetical protein
MKMAVPETLSKISENQEGDSLSNNGIPVFSGIISGGYSAAALNRSYTISNPSGNQPLISTFI